MSRECSREGITNRDGTCTLVAVYQLLRKTCLYLFINDDLRTTVDSATKLGWHSLSVCVPPPLLVRTIYKQLAGEEITGKAGVFTQRFLIAVVRASDRLKDDTDFAEFDSRQLHKAVTDAATSKKWQINFVDGTTSLKRLLELLLRPTNTLVGGIIGSESHDVAFIMCNHDPLFHNWGRVMSGTEMLQNLNEAHTFLKGVNRGEFVIGDVITILPTKPVPANWHAYAPEPSSSWFSELKGWFDSRKKPLQNYEIGESVQVRSDDDSKWSTTLVTQEFPLVFDSMHFYNDLYQIRKPMHCKKPGCVSIVTAADRSVQTCEKHSETPKKSMYDATCRVCNSPAITLGTNYCPKHNNPKHNNMLSDFVDFVDVDFIDWAL